MKRLSHRTLIILLAALLPLALMTGCGGGGGSASSAGNSGTVAVLLTDGPAEEFAVIEVEVTEVAIQPDDEAADWVILYENPQGHRFNLLDLRDQEKVLTVSNDVPAGMYRKIRLRLNDYIYAEKTNGDPADMQVKIPSGKIDLNPRGTFEVVPGEALSITLDIDADKSINFHKAGKSGKWIFRPVVFVDVETVIVPDKCPQILKGTIEEIAEPVASFTLNLGEGRDLLTVNVSSETLIFGADGLPAGTDALLAAFTAELDVRVRGWLDTVGSLDASLIVVGDVMVLKGTVTAGFDGGQFALALDAGQPVVGEQLAVALGEGALVLTGCDETVGPDAIKTGMSARIVGKLSIDEPPVFQAVAVLLKFREVTGDLLAIAEAEGGYTLTVATGDPVANLSVFLPAAVVPHLENDGPVGVDRLMTLLDCGRTFAARLVVSGDDPANVTASELWVEPDVLSDGQALFGGAVSDGVLNVSAMLGGVPGEFAVDVSGAEIWDQTGAEDVEVPLAEAVFTKGPLLIYGLEACADDPDVDVDFYAHMIFIKAPATP